MCRAEQTPQTESFRIMKMKGDGRCMFRAIGAFVSRLNASLVPARKAGHQWAWLLALAPCSKRALIVFQECGKYPTAVACGAAYGLNRNQGQVITDADIEKEADELRLACRDALCRSAERRKQFAEAVEVMETVEDPLPR